MKPLTVEDKLAIHELMARYAWALDTGDSDALAACFVEDGVAVEDVFEEADRWEGRAGVRAMGEHYRNAPGFPGRQHPVSHVLIEGNAERATSKAMAFVTECHGEPPYLLRFCGWYEDVLEKREGVWLFWLRTIRLWDGPVLGRFPGHDGAKLARKRPDALKLKKG
jgi:hypothetical protein